MRYIFIVLILLLLTYDVMCHFYLLLFPLFDLCLTSRYSHYSCLLSSIFCLYTLSYDLLNTLCLSVFCLPFSVQFIICLLPYSIFCPMFLCSVSIIIFPPFVHYSLPSISDLDNLTFYFLWLCESFFTFSVDVILMLLPALHKLHLSTRITKLIGPPKIYNITCACHYFPYPTFYV